MTGSRRLPLLLCVALGVLPGAALAAPASVGVAPFERVAPPGASVPDVARLLADRIASRGVARVVGPEELAGLDGAEAPPERVKEAAEAAEVETLVLGRTTRLGSRLSLDVRLHAGATGLARATYVEEAAGPDGLAGAVDRLAARITGGPPAEAPAAVSAAPPAAPPAEAAGEAPEPAAGGGAGTSPAPPWDTDAPIEIESDELEAFQKGGARRLVFKRNVRASQGDMRLRASELEALYPGERSQPSRLVARGGVEVVMGEQRVGCARATYDRAAGWVECRGEAWMRENGDTLRGEVIRMDLATDRVTVTGGARVFLAAEEEPADAAAGSPDGEGAP